MPKIPDSPSSALSNLYALEKRLAATLPDVIKTVNDADLRSKLRRELYEIRQHLRDYEDEVMATPKKADLGRKVIKNLPLPPGYKITKITTTKKIGRFKISGGTAVLFAYRIPRSKNY